MSKRSSFTIFIAVVKALFLREVQTRFGAQRLGYVWAVVDPTARIIVFSIIKMLLFSGAVLAYDYPVFLATSFLAYDLFVNTTKKSMDAFGANKALFAYKQVKPFDTVVVRYIVEFLVTVMATLVLIVAGLFIGFDLRVENVNMVILGVVWISLFGLGLGLLFAVLGHFYENLAKVVNLMLMPLFFVSALFYTVDSLPPVAREFILYNPVVHFIEMIHGNYFAALHTEYVDYNYMMLWTLVPMFMGLYLYRRAEEGIIAS
jgi:capsular polysaccharide transport system permease protein